MVVCCDKNTLTKSNLGEEGLFTLHSHIKVLETGTEVEAVEGGAFLTGLFLACSDYFLIVTSSWGATDSQSLESSHIKHESGKFRTGLPSGPSAEEGISTVGASSSKMTVVGIELI